MSKPRTKLCFLSRKGKKSPKLTVFREGELENRGDEEGQGALGVVDFPAALAQPPRLSLVRYLIQAAVLSCHKNTAQVCGCDGDHVGVVCRDREKRIWQQLHPTRHAVVQTCNRIDKNI